MPENWQQQVGILTTERKKHLLMHGSGVWSKIYRRDKLFVDEQGNEFFDIFPADMFYEDTAAGAALLMRFDHLEMVPEGLYYYYQHAASTVHSVSVEKMHHRIRTGYVMKENALRYGYYDEFRDEIDELIIGSMYEMTLYHLIVNIKEPTAKLLTELRDAVAEVIPYWESSAACRRRAAMYYGSSFVRVMQLHYHCPLLAPAAYWSILYLRKIARLHIELVKLLLPQSCWIKLKKLLGR